MSSEYKRVIDTTNKRTGYLRDFLITWHGGGYSLLREARRNAEIVYCEKGVK